MHNPAKLADLSRTALFVPDRDGEGFAEVFIGRAGWRAKPPQKNPGAGRIRRTAPAGPFPRAPFGPEHFLSDTMVKSGLWK